MVFVRFVLHEGKLRVSLQWYRFHDVQKLIFLVFISCDLCWDSKSKKMHKRLIEVEGEKGAFKRRRPLPLAGVSWGLWEAYGCCREAIKTENLILHCSQLRWCKILCLFSFLRCFLGFLCLYLKGQPKSWTGNEGEGMTCSKWPQGEIKPVAAAATQPLYMGFWLSARGRVQMMADVLNVLYYQEHTHLSKDVQLSFDFVLISGCCVFLPHVSPFIREQHLK